MNETYSTRIMFLSTDEQVSKLMDLGRETQDPTALQQHQMDSPINFDLGTVRESELQRKKTTESFAEATRSSIKTFRDLFTNRNPPLDLLKLSQKFFKHRLALEPHDSINQKVSYLFYLMSIVVARVRCGVNISKLTNQQQLQTINSIVKQPWVQDQIRELLAEGRQRISSELDR